MLKSIKLARAHARLDKDGRARQSRTTGHRIDGSWLFVAAMLVVYAALVCLRMPQIIIRGRFWAEEGAIFFRNAWDLPPLQALFTSFGGYLNLVANAAPLLARWILPLPLAPYLTILVALSFQLCPPLLILTARDGWLRPPHVRLAAILLMLAVPASEEIWLQTLHCQFELSLSSAIILALDVPSGLPVFLRLGFLFLAPLCGPTAIALTPLFVLRTIMDRSRGRAIQTAILAAGGCIQLLLFFRAVQGRGYALDPFVFLCVLTVRHLDVPFLGVWHADAAAATIRARRAAGHIPWQAILLPILAFGALALAALWQSAARPARWLLCAASLLAAASYFGALGGAATLINVWNGYRYSVVPQALLGLAILALAATTHRWTARASWFAVIWLLVVGAWEYAHPLPLISKGPSWRKEVALWRKDPTHALKIWPSGWSITLDPAHR